MNDRLQINDSLTTDEWHALTFYGYNPWLAAASVSRQRIEWIKKGKENMQHRWIIEVKADFADETKYSMVEDLCREVACLLHSCVGSIRDNNQVPMVIMHNDDFFTPAKQIAIVSVEQGERLLGILVDKYRGQLEARIAGTAPAQPAESVDPELLEALEEMR